MILCEYLFMRCMSSGLGTACGLLYGLAEPSRDEVESERSDEVDATGERSRRDWRAAIFRWGRVSLVAKNERSGGEPNKPRGAQRRRAPSR